MRSDTGKTIEAEGSLIHGSSAFLVATHELKAPLALIRQLSLALEAGQMTQPEQQRMIHQMTLTSERALRLTSDLTKTARLEDALFELEPVNAQQLCEDIAQELTPLFTAYGRRIRVARRRKQTLMVANRDLLRRIILNFSDNALHYSQDVGEVELQTKRLPDGRIRVGVRDFGPALSKEVWHDLIEHLNRPQAIHARPQSSGLGLYIASQFAQVMKGNIGVIRHKDGATFYVDMTASTQLSLL